MALRVTLADDVASYLEKRSLNQNKPFDQVVDEILRQVMRSDTSNGDNLSEDKVFYTHHGRLNPALEGESLNQVLDDLYVKDYLDKTRR